MALIKYVTRNILYSISIYIELMLTLAKAFKQCIFHWVAIP